MKFKTVDVKNLVEIFIFREPLSYNDLGFDKRGTIFMRKQNRKGFTLAELLIVVAIIAVLVAVAIPLFTSHVETVCLMCASSQAGKC